MYQDFSIAIVVFTGSYRFNLEKAPFGLHFIEIFVMLFNKAWSVKLKNELLSNNTSNHNIEKKNKLMTTLLLRGSLVFLKRPKCCVSCVTICSVWETWQQERSSDHLPINERGSDQRAVLIYHLKSFLPNFFRLLIAKCSVGNN